ncbi:MAG: hypothetical protein KGI50_00810 [Patescibacteria group bacterium]|nr:hypothetical protein [Patescibacteria group bacterium]MDE2438106.1 hypothetical protein [Patescibacteria group bacterium]
MRYFSRIHEWGTTLAELIVAITLFLVVLSVLTPSLITVLRTQRNVDYLVRMQSDLSYSMEYMAREIRTGYNFIPPSAGDTSTLQFTNAHGDDVVYHYDGTSLTKRVNGGQPIPLISSNVTLSHFQFFVTGAEPYSTTPAQTSVVILATASPKSGLTDISTVFQTTITPMVKKN